MKRVKLPEPVADLYRAVEKLEKTYGRKFPLNGHMLGAIGAIVAQEVFGFELLPARDARCKVRGNVLVETTGAGGKFIAFRRDCNHLLVLQVSNPEEAAIVYDGPGAPAWEAAYSNSPSSRCGSTTQSSARLEPEPPTCVVSQGGRYRDHSRPDSVGAGNVRPSNSIVTLPLG
jgi:hypothetical protein